MNYVELMKMKWIDIFNCLINEYNPIFLNILIHAL